MNWYLEFVVITLCFHHIVDGQQISASALKAFANFKKTNGKQYASKAEEKYRANVFAKNLAFIEEHNAQEDSTFTLEANEYSDMTQQEFLAQNTGKGMPSKDDTSKDNAYVAQLSGQKTIPKSVDWRDEGYVTAVKNQGQCGSCGFFSTVGSLEGVWAKNTGELIDMSEQHPGDCTFDYIYGKQEGRGMCEGSGPAENVWKYLRDHGGIMSEEDYPYTAENGDCKFDKSKIVAKVTGWKEVPHQKNGDLNITALKIAVASEGTIDVYINAAPREFMNYGGGIYRVKKCDGKLAPHGLVVVGYGSEKGDDYWIVKNSWGEGWGENGYMRMATDFKSKGKCYDYEKGIYYPNFPTVK